jgi:hypothetical protein
LRLRVSAVVHSGDIRMRWHQSASISPVDGMYFCQPVDQAAHQTSIWGK